MTGVGGIFPNYEDHLLDKKKISECFSGNFHEILYPLNYTSKHGPWQYHSPQDNKHFIDLNTLTWNGKIRVINKKDPNSPVIATNQTKDITCSVVNNFIHSTVSKITYQLNDFQMGDSAPKSYSYRAYMDNLLSFSKGAKEQSLKYHGFEQDTPGSFEDVNKLTASNTNSGFKKRSELFCTPNFFHFSVKLRIDLANIDQFLQPGVQMRFEIERNSDAFALLSDVGDDVTFEFEIKDSTIEFDKMIPTPEYLNHFEKNILQEPLIYSYDKSQIHYFPYSANVNDLSIYSMFHTDKLPSYLVFGLVDNDAFDGSVSKNPYNFKHFDLKEFYLLVNGISVPTQPVKLNITSMDYHQTYVNEFLDKLKLKNSNDSIGISANDWINGSFFWIVDLNVDKCCNFHEHNSKGGTIHLKLQTKTALPKTTRLIVYSTSRERMSIDHNTGKVSSTENLS
jgi:hypothetical protein